MSAQAIVRCPACSQKYRVNAAAIGRSARCKVCGAGFVIGRKTRLDDDTVVSWIMQDAPASASVMGSTGIFHDPDDAASPAPVGSDAPGAPPDARPSPAGDLRVRLVTIDADGAHFEFPASALTNEDLRNSFPRQCVGCAATHGLGVHLIHWPERMTPDERSRWNELQNRPVGRLDAFRNAATKALLGTLPASRHAGDPFRLPFPIFVCGHCHASRDVRGHVLVRQGADVCYLTIASLGVAVEFFRNNGGRGTSAYDQLVEERNRRRDPWHDLAADVRQRISHWFEPRPGEQFVRFFRDAEFSPLETGVAGVVVTSSRLVFRKYAAHRDYLLNEPCRVEIRAKGSNASVQIIEPAQRPAVLTLTATDANEFAAVLRACGSCWTISV